MKALLRILILNGLFVSCHDVQPSEKAATISMRDRTYCGFCGGWFIWVDSTMYRSEVPTAYAKENKAVWIRYESDERPGYKAGHWINIQSIRQR